MSVFVGQQSGDLRDLDPAGLAESARQAAGAGPDEPLRFHDGLTALTAALDSQAGLTRAGRERVRAALVNTLAGQFPVRRLLDRHPEIDRVPVRPVFITGLLRTGTTILQHLLAQHPDLRSPRMWELMAPAASGHPDELIAACGAYIEEYYRVAPRFQAIHPLDARLPEECHRLTANSFRSAIYQLRYHVPAYGDWLSQQSMVAAYEYHRTQLRCLLWRAPGPVGAPVVLKCPSHLWHQTELARVYPDAKIIRLHRSPTVALPSVCSLTSVVRGARSDRVDRAEIGRYWLDHAATALVGLRRGVGPLATPPLDIRYADLVADPFAVLARVCDYIGVEFTEAARARMATFLAEHRQSAHGAHRYTAEEFGLTRRELARRFSEYIAEFDL